METNEIIKTLRNFRRKWRTEITREHKLQRDMRVKYSGDYVPGCYEKSVGIDIGYSSCAMDIDKLIKELEHQQRVDGWTEQLKAEGCHLDGT